MVCPLFPYFPATRIEKRKMPELRFRDRWDRLEIGCLNLIVGSLFCFAPFAIVWSGVAKLIKPSHACLNMRGISLCGEGVVAEHAFYQVIIGLLFSWVSVRIIYAVVREYLKPLPGRLFFVLEHSRHVKIINFSRESDDIYMEAMHIREDGYDISKIKIHLRGITSFSCKTEKFNVGDAGYLFRPGAIFHFSPSVSNQSSNSCNLSFTWHFNSKILKGRLVIEAVSSSVSRLYLR